VEIVLLFAVKLPQFIKHLKYESRKEESCQLRSLIYVGFCCVW